VGLLLTVGSVAAAEGVRRYLVPVPNPQLLVLLATAYSAYLGGTWAGMASAGVAVAYAAWSLSEPGAPLRYAPENLLRLVVLAAVTPAVAAVVGFLRDRLRREAEEAGQLRARWEAAEARRSLEEAFALLFRYNPQPMWVYDLETLRFLAVNRAAVAKYGYSEDEFLQMSIADIRPEEDVPRLLEDVRKPRPELQQSGVWRHRSKDGRVLHVEITSHQLEFAGRPAALVVAHDVTERLRAEQALRESESLFRALVEQSLVGVYLIQDGTFRYVNPAACSILGYPEEELIGADLARFVHPEDWPVVRDNLRRRLAGEVEAAQYEFRCVRKDGRVVHVQVHGRRTEYQGRPAVIGTALDVTEQKQAEEALRTLARELEERVRERTAQLEAANRELEAFSYSVAHDLRAPLRSIDGFSQALLEDYGDRLDEVGRDYLQRVRAASQRMAELIDDLLQLAKVSRQPLQVQEVDLSAVARGIGEELRQRHPTRAVELRVQEGVVARADPKLVAVALQNLLENAWKFTTPRARAAVEFGTVHTEEGLVCFVRDNGVGFDMRYADKLFAPFQRLHRPSEFPGTGIGLATVQRVVARHGGRVWAEAEVDRGATFYFTLPGLEVRGAGQADPVGGRQSG
jgi:PAS domain S-box-containing protein